jgi:hypothetical protein
MEALTALTALLALLALLEEVRRCLRTAEGAKSRKRVWVSMTTRAAKRRDARGGVVDSVGAVSSAIDWGRKSERMGERLDILRQERDGSGLRFSGRGDTGWSQSVRT